MPTPATPLRDSARDVRRIVLVGLVANLLLAALKALAGVLGDSRALVADAIHSLTDCVTDIALLVAAGVWTAPPDEKHPHGHRRVETVTSVVVGLFVGVAALGIGWDAVSMLITPRESQPGWFAFGAAAASIIVKEALYRWTRREGERRDSPALIANAWHHRSDALSSVPVAVAVAVAAAAPELAAVDVIAALLVSAFVLRAAWRITWPAVEELMDKGAPSEEVANFRTLCLETPGVRGCHAMRSRYLGGRLQLDLHLQVDPEMTVRAGHEVAHAVTSRLMETYPNVGDVVVHVEPDESIPDAPAEAARETCPLSPPEADAAATPSSSGDPHV